uniref:Uncharacterized protein n=1 Tax=Tanacetum cinerariifolium TaxID=118510 RepID=A0A699H5Y1_TANCI|nr:hypothetical protein [Tanacetum cinerariifolium]
MSDVEDSAVTYTSISSDDGLSDIGSPGDDVFPVEEQPLTAAASPTAESPCYILESNSEEDDEDLEEDPEEDPTNYPADGGDDDNDDDESYDDDEEDDDDVDIEEEEDEDEDKEEHLDPVYSTNVALPAIDHAPSTEETEPFETCGSFDFNRSLSLKCV